VALAASVWAAPASAQAPCRVEVSPGKFVSCRAFLDEKAPKPETPADATAPADNKTGPGGHPLRNGFAWGGAREAPKPKPVVEAAPLQPLDALYAEVNALKAQQQKLKREALPWQEKDVNALTNELKWQQMVVDDIEDRLPGRVQRCAAAYGKTISFPNYRMTPDGPVLLSAAERMAYAKQAPLQCNPSLLVTQEEVNRLKARVALERRLEETKWGWSNRQEKAALEEQLKQMKREM